MLAAGSYLAYENPSISRIVVKAAVSMRVKKSSGLDAVIYGIYDRTCLVYLTSPECFQGSSQG